VEKLDDATYILDAANPAAHPSTVRQDVMPLGFSRRNQLVTYLYREWQVGQTIAVQVPKLSSGHTELDAAEPMRLNRYTRPVGNCLLDLPRDISAHESSVPLSHAVVPTRPGRPRQAIFRRPGRVTIARCHPQGF
jgi:hypothetical protein